jgi:hypothetical protein
MLGVLAFAMQHADAILTQLRILALITHLFAI